MSAQCWCYRCAGRVVSRHTFVAHGRKDVPDAPSRKRTIDMVSMPRQEHPHQPDQLADEADSSGAEEGDEGDGEPTAHQQNLDTWSALFGDAASRTHKLGRGGLTAEQVVVLLLDWMCATKATDECAKGIWTIIEACLPADVQWPTFRQVRASVFMAEGRFARRIDICPNDCVAYVDTLNLPPAFATENAHRTACPECGEARYVQRPGTSVRVPAKVVYHFPLVSYVQSLFNRPELVPELFTDCGERPEGHLARSRGYRYKVLDNPHLNKEHRNLAIVGSTDGVPLFDDQVRGAWPFMYRSV